MFDHHGMTEVGPVSYECPVRPGVLHVIETSYVAEIIDPQTGRAIDFIVPRSEQIVQKRSGATSLHAHSEKLRIQIRWNRNFQRFAVTDKGVRPRCPRPARVGRGFHDVIEICLSGKV